ncbi:MAG TPA: hypothetical protein VHX59_12245 [Mycobacteriales bacterium]|nr:hypothetical protein [Mycobacteriales bacterium]
MIDVEDELRRTLRQPPAAFDPTAPGVTVEDVVRSARRRRGMLAAGCAVVVALIAVGIVQLTGLRHQEPASEATPALVRDAATQAVQDNKAVLDHPIQWVIISAAQWNSISGATLPTTTGRVYLLQMQGRFQCLICHHPSATDVPRSSVLLVETPVQASRTDRPGYSLSNVTIDLNRYGAVRTFTLSGR